MTIDITNQSIIDGSAVSYQEDSSVKWGSVAQSAHKKLKAAEKELVNLLSQDNPDEGAIEKYKQRIQTIQRALEAISTITKSMHDLVMSLIRKLRLN